MKQMDFFDVNKLPTFNKQIKVSRSKLSGTYTIDPITHYDQFVSKGYEYLILPHYLKTTNAENILQNYNFVTVDNCYKKDYEPSFLAFRETSLPNTYIHTHDIVMCVYFLQNKNEEIERFFDYYLAQGVEKIFMYYCGRLSERPNLPQRKEVEYLEWPHVFWHEPPEYTHPVHNLQIPLYNMFAKKIGMSCNWSIFCDLDEYIKAPNHTLKEYLNNYMEPTHLFTQHRYSCINFNTNEVVVEPQVTNPQRGKLILKGSILTPPDMLNVHHCLQAKTSNLLMLHNRDSESFYKLKQSNFVEH